MNVTILLFLFSLVSLLFAYTSEYAFGMLPCILCLYQRIPFFIVLALSVLALFFKNRFKVFLIFLCGIMLIIGSGVAFYHVGVEQGRFQHGDGCSVGEATSPSTIEEMTMQLFGKPNVPCDEPQFVFLVISMAGWNFLFSSSVGIITLIMVFRLYKNIKFIGKSDEYTKNNS